MSGSDPTGPDGALRIGVAYTGDAEDRTERSGTPYGVLHGVRQLGHRGMALRAAPPRNVDRVIAGVDAVANIASSRNIPSKAEAKKVYQGAHLGRLTSFGRTAALRTRRVEVDGVIALGSGYTPPRGVPYVVYDDMTVQQAIDAGYPAWASMRESDRKFRLAQQKRIYAAAVGCCMTTSWAAESVVRDYGIPDSRVHVVGAGTHEQMRVVDRDWSTPRFLFVGLDWERKNGPRVLEAFGRLREQVPAARLDVVGGHPPIDAPGVTTHGRLYRNRPEDAARLERLYDEATCFVMPSLHEPGGVVIVEAAAVGIGAIAGSVGGSRDFVGDAGFVVDPADGDQIFQAMVAMSDPSTAEQKGRLASERAQHFTWSAVADRILDPLRARRREPTAT